MSPNVISSVLSIVKQLSVKIMDTVFNSCNNYTPNLLMHGCQAILAGITLGSKKHVMYLNVDYCPGAPKGKHQVKGKLWH